MNGQPHMRSLHVETKESIAEISRGKWNDLARGHGLFASHDYLTAVERDAVYLLVAAENEYVAALPIYPVAGEDNPYYLPAFHFSGLQPGQTKDTGLGLLAGSRSGYCNSILIHRTVISEERDRALVLLFGALREVLARRNLPCAFFLFLTLQGLDDLRRAVPGARASLTYAGDTWLTVKEPSFDDYLGNLRSGRRYMIRREMRRFEEAGLTVLVEDPRAVVHDTARLIDLLHRKYQVPSTAPDLADTLVRQYDSLGERGVAFLCQLNGVTVGVTFGYIWDGWLYLRAAGFDYDLLPGQYEYFNLAVYAPVRYCCEHRLKGLHLGATCYEAKILRGAKVYPLVSAIVPASGDIVPAVHGLGTGVREYWGQQMTALPSGFEQSVWRQVMNEDTFL
jgi:uncharacterized protein